MIVATHWHDDHIRGLGEILAECPNAEFVFSTALLKEEFLSLICAYGERQYISSGVNEFNDVLKLLESRGQEVILASENKCILKKTTALGECEIHSLSPSDASILQALQHIGRLLPIEGERKNDLVMLQPNHLAIVLWVRVGDFHLLLGSDLQNMNSQKIGWERIVQSSKRPQGSAEAFKVPHHGSANADEESVWKLMLNRNPQTVVTPFCLGKVKIPTYQDVQRLISRTDNGYITAPPVERKARHEKLVKQFLEAATTYSRIINPDFGGVRMKWPHCDTGDCRVDLFGGAQSLNQLL